MDGSEISNALYLKIGKQSLVLNLSFGQAGGNYAQLPIADRD
jgi:hypothetical protein